jgi:hypothetical protein
MDEKYLKYNLKASDPDQLSPLQTDQLNQKLIL